MIIRSSKLQEGETITVNGDEIIMNKVVDIEPVLKANYESRKDSQNGFSKDHEWRRVLTVPMEVLMMWKQEYPEIMSGDHEAEDSALKKLLKREENKLFSTVENVKGIF